MFWLAIPIYYFVYGMGSAYFAPNGIELHTVIMTATFTHGFWPDTISSLVHGGWSIAVEMTFYLFFPLIFLPSSSSWRFF
jgi:exopolysaccharide production protein ExoZ